MPPSCNVNCLRPCLNDLELFLFGVGEEAELEEAKND